MHMHAVYLLAILADTVAKPENFVDWQSLPLNSMLSVRVLCLPVLGRQIP